MLKKLARKISNNFSLKILATLFAVILWIVVVNIDDPVRAESYTTSVVQKNQNYLRENGKYGEILNGNNTVSFTVSAKRSYQEKLSNSDFSAVADMEKIEFVEANNTYRVPVVISCSKYSTNQVSISSKQTYIELSVEDLGSVQKRITPVYKGNVLDGCAIGELGILTSNLLKITGPLSVTSQIDTVEAEINVEGLSSDVRDTVVPILYDKDRNVIDTTKLSMNLDTVTISAQILNTKDVSVEFKTSGVLAEGYVQKGVEYTPETVRIKGEAEILNAVNKITVPEEVLDLTDATASIETTVDISSYLPSGVTLVIASDAKVGVKVNIEPIVKQTFDIPVSALTIENVREGYEADFTVDKVTVEIAGAESDMELLTEKSIIGVVDVTGLGRGDHDILVNFKLDETLYQTTAEVEVPVSIDVSDAAQPDETEGNTGNGSGVVIDTEEDTQKESETAEKVPEDSEVTKDTEPTETTEAVSGRKS